MKLLLSMLKHNFFLRGIVGLYLSYFGLRRSKFGHCGKGVILIPPISINCPQNIYLYDNTNIYSANILCSRAKFIMKTNSGAASGLTVITGGHLSVVGKPFKTITDNDKDILDPLKSLDKDIVVEEDVWIASNVTLLSGVTIGRGAIIGSGCVVRRNIPPYAITIGNPAKVVGFKFSVDEIIEHEKILYSESQRIPIDILEYNYNKYYLNRIKEIKNYIKL